MSMTQISSCFHLCRITNTVYAIYHYIRRSPFLFFMKPQKAKFPCLETFCYMEMTLEPDLKK